MYISEPAEYAILGLLESQPMHGYEMFQQFKNGALGQIVRLRSKATTRSRCMHS